MFELLPLERHLFLGILVLSFVSSVLGYMQIAKGDVKFRCLLSVFASLQVTLGATLLICRATAVGGLPITGVFESMLFLMIFIGIIFLSLSVYVRQAWFLSIMAWSLFVIVLLSAVVAKPAAALQDAAQTPWVVIHAVAMSLAGAMVVFAAAMSGLFLWSRMRLKGKQFLNLFGTMPTIEKLESLNLLGLRLSFAALTIGLISGVGLVAARSAELGMTTADWLMDSKIVLIAVSWILLLLVLLLRRLLAFSGKTIAQATLFVCFLILFAFIGSQIFCKSDHDFTCQTQTRNPHIEQIYADHTGRH